MTLCGYKGNTMLKLFWIICFIGIGWCMPAQSVPKDSITGWENVPARVARFRTTPTYQIVKSGVPLVLSSALALSVDKQIQRTRDAHISGFSNEFDNYLQYAPVAAMLGMKLAGVKGRSSWGEMITADAFSVAVMAGVVNGLKYTVKRERPDGSTHNSFPSGHTATAFMAATMLYKEYGDVSPWIGIGAYTSSTLVAVGRMMNNRHWLSDVLAGAGIGIMSTELGYFLSDLIFKKKPLQEVLGPSSDYRDVPSYIEYSVGYSCLFPSEFRVNGRNVRAYGGVNTAISGAYYLNSGWGIGMQANIQSAKLTHHQGVVGCTSFSVGPGYSKLLLPRLFWNSQLQIGYVRLLYNRERRHDGVSGMIGTSLIGQLTPTLGLRLYADYMYTSLPFFESGKRLNYLNTGIAVSALF